MKEVLELEDDILQGHLAEHTWNQRPDSDQAFCLNQTYGPT